MYTPEGRIGENMAKGKTSIYFCQCCGYESSKWMGQCPGCKEWNSFVEEPVKVTAKGKRVTMGVREDSKPVALSEIDLKEEDRLTTDIVELDRVLGGGIVAGSLTLVGGDPGIGKSTLLLQVCQRLAAKKVEIFLDF